MSGQGIRMSQSGRQKPSILFAASEYRGNRLSLLSVYFQTFAYYDSILTSVAIPLQLLIFIYKYNILYYESNAIAGQIILLVLGYFLNMWRLSLGRSGNKGKKYSNIIGYFILSAILIVGFFYIIAIQPNILWLQFITFLIVLILSIIQLLLMIVLAIYYRANEI